MSHDMTGHDSSAAPTRGAYEERLPEAYIELLTLLEDMDVYVHQITQNWPKTERHGLAAAARQQVTALQRLTAMSFLAVMRHANAAVTTRQMLNRFVLRSSPC